MSNGCIGDCIMPVGLVILDPALDGNGETTEAAGLDKSWAPFGE